MFEIFLDLGPVLQYTNKASNKLLKKYRNSFFYILKIMLIYEG